MRENKSVSVPTYIVTDDRGLLAIGSFMGIPIVTARTFLDLVDD